MVHGRTIAAAAFAAAFGLGAAPGPGSPVSSLQGVPAFRVVVEQLGPAAERAGVRRETLQVDVETALARAGIKSSAAADAILYVNVSVACDVVACAFNVAVEAQQKVRLDSRPEAPPFVAATWSGGVTGVAGTKAGIVRRTVREQVGRFAAAWREANPGK